MPLISLPVPSVVEGLSEKPPHLAGQGKFKTLENFIPLDESGLIQRPGTNWAAKVATGFPDLKLVPVDFGGSDRYVLALGHDRAQVYFRNGVTVPVYTVTRTAGVPSGSSVPDFSYLDLRTPQTPLNTDNLRTAGGAWALGLAAVDTALGTGPLKPLAFPDPGALNDHNYSELTTSTGGPALYTQAINGNIFQGIVKVSVYVNTLVDGGATRAANCDKVEVSVTDPADGTAYGIIFDFDGDYTSPPVVLTNTGNCTPVIEQIDTYNYRLGAIFDGTRLSPGATSNSLQVSIEIDDGAAGDGIYAGDFLFELEGDRDALGPYAQPPETLKTTTIGNTVHVVNPLIATRADRTVESTSLLDVYGTRTFTNDTSTLPGNGHGAGSNETSVDIADAAYLYVKVGAFSTTYGVEIKMTDTGVGGTSVTLTDSVTTTTAGTPTANDTDIIAQQLLDLIAKHTSNTSGLTNETRIIEGERVGSVVKFETKSGTAGTAQHWVIDHIRVIDSLGEAAVFAWHDTVSVAAELPLLAQDDTRVILTEPTDDDPTEVPPQVILRFVGESTGIFGKGYWKEGMDYGLDTGFDETTLPYTLTRRVDDITGIVTGNGKQIYFEWAPHTWDARIAGDDTTNDYPSFITPEVDEGLNDRYITAIGYYQDRLLLCSGGDIILSAAGRRSVFCRTTIQSVPDSERIDVRSSASTASTYFDAPYAGGVQYLRSKRSLDRVTFQGALSARTIGVEPLYVGTSSELVDAIGVYNGLCLPAKGQRSDFLRYIPQPDEENLREVVLTDDIPKLPGTGLSSLIWSPDYRMLFIHTRTRPAQILGCRFVLDGNNVLQKAWTKINLNDQAINSMCLLDDDLFVLVNRSDGQHLESFPLILNPADKDIDSPGATEPWSVRLDRRITENDLLAVMSFGSGVTTIQLPYDMVDSTKFTVVHRDGSDFGVPLTISSTDTATPGAHLIKLTGDQTAHRLFIGEVATAKAIPIRPTLSQQTRRGALPAVSSRIIVRQVELSVVDTAYLDVLIRDLIPNTTVPATAGSAPLYNGESATAVTLDTRPWSVFVGGRPEETEVEINNGTHKPTNISGLEWKLEVVDRGGRVSL